MEPIRISRRAALAAIALAGGGLPARADLATEHLPWANSLVDSLRTQTLAGVYTSNGVKLNQYSSDKIFQWLEDGYTLAINRSQCSSFVAGLLKRANHWSDAFFKAKFGSTWPNAETYYNQIVAETNFTRIQPFSALQPGDILAASYKNDPTATSTGHVMVVSSVMPLASFHYLTQGVTVYFHDVQIMDSSSGPHSLDTRIFQPGELGVGSPLTEWDGAGRGWMRVYTDPLGATVGYTWSMTGNKSDAVGTPASWNYYSKNLKTMSVRPLAGGRLK